jgi:hypothetical protein
VLLEEERPEIRMANVPSYTAADRDDCSFTKRSGRRGEAQHT